jgi:hypothetical protein
MRRGVPLDQLDFLPTFVAGLQIHWCLSQAACRRNQSQFEGLVAWAHANAAVPTDQLDDTAYVVGARGC